MYAYNIIIDKFLDICIHGNDEKVPLATLNSYW